MDRAGPYRLLSRVGSGGFGEVHIALDPQGRTVAVKLLHPHVTGDASALARLAREVETMRRVRSPHVAEVLDASLTGDRPYIVTRYVQGKPLTGPLTGDALVRLARGLANAVAAMHSAGVVHRDLKPSNVILADGEPVVIDFGIAYAVEGLSLTASGSVVGTPGYLAPEVLEGARGGTAADVFAWAATVAYAATGRQPYGGGPPAAIGYRVVHQEPDLGGIPVDLAALLRSCLRADPSLRPTAGQVCASLSSAVTRTDPLAMAVDDPVATQEVPGIRVSPTEEARQRRAWRIRLWWTVGSAILVALISGAAYDYAPELPLLVQGALGVVLVGDAVIGRGQRAVLDLVSGLGSAALAVVLIVSFSSITVAILLGVVLVLFTLLALLS